MTDVHQGSDLDALVDGMIAHMKMQIENPVLLNSRFRFNEVLFLDANFHCGSFLGNHKLTVPPDLAAGRVWGSRLDASPCYQDCDPARGTIIT